MKIGIVGAENTHTAAIARLINVDKAISGFSVEYVWGETDEFAHKAAADGHIPTIVSDPHEMLGNIDAVVVDHRHPRHHLEAAMPFVEAGVPTFVDKPFCYRADRGAAFLKHARERGTPVTSFGVLPEQTAYRRFADALRGRTDVVAGATYGPCDIGSPYGGVFFYGIHHVEMAVNLFGFDVAGVLGKRSGANAVGQLIYADGRIVTLNFIDPSVRSRFAMTVATAEELSSAQIEFDQQMYLNGVRTFTQMFKTREEPIPHDRILTPIRILEAMERSLETGTVQTVSTTGETR